MIDSENKKLERMNKLVENAIVYEMRKNKIEQEIKHPSLREKMNIRKKGYLENNGIETNWTIDEVQECIEKKNKKIEEENKPKIYKKLDIN